MKSKKHQIKFIIEQDFNFNNVLTAMKSLNRRYNNSRTFPTIRELKKVAEHCLTMCAETNSHFSMGGFEADIINGILELNFNIEKSNLLNHMLSGR